MEKQSASNFKIKYILLGILFSILFIFTALNISTPLTAYAEDDGGEDMDLGDGSVSWIGSVDAEGMNYVYIPGKIYWGGSDTRTGLLFYCMDNETNTIVPGTITILYNQEMDGNGEYWMGEISAHYGSTRVGGQPTYNIQAQLNTSIPNTGAWENTDGSPIKAWLEGESTMTLANGDPAPIYAYLVRQYCGDEALQKVIHQDYSVCFEGMYGIAIYKRVDGKDVVRSYSPTVIRLQHPEYFYTDDGGEYACTLSDEELAELSIIKYFTTMRCLAQVYKNVGIDITQRYGDNGTANYKWIQSSSRYFRTAEDHFGVPAASSAGTAITADEIKTTGWNFAVLTMNLPPIHTYDSSKGTPGNTQTPDPNDGTDGDCTIKKLYYTQELSSDGTILTEAKDYHPYTQTSTTAYISIDTESDYEIEGWKTSTTNTTLNTKEQFNSITPTHTGTSSQEILLDQDNGEKYLYILYKKTEVNPNPPQPYDFQLQQSQITKRVSFMTPDANSTTQQLFTHNFTWTAPAPSKTSCTANSNKGHLKCTTSEHTHSDSCYTEDADGNKSLTCTTSEHTHTDSCYEKCSSWKWTDNTTSLGITLDTSTINKAVVSKNDSITYNQPAVNTITTSNKYNKDNTSTRSGTSPNTQSISNFNYITVLFRGQDHLTLADWKNGGAISYLTNLAYDSAYNFKSANTPQGTRKSGTEYNETFVTRFINRSPDMSTTYKATVGSAGICSTTSSSYRFDTDFTLNDIVVNIKVFWADGVAPSASGSMPSSQTAGSANFYPYISMRYDNNTQKDKRTYVLGQKRRSVTLYDYATVYISGGDNEISINSSQWSTHADAKNNIVAKFSGRTLSASDTERIQSSVLPGGATLSISAHSNDTRKIYVKTIQAYLTGAGKTQVDVTGGTSTLPTDEASLKSIHEGLVSSVSGVASRAYIAQYISTGAKLNVSDMTGAQLVKSGDTFNGNNTTFSTDSKYNFNRYADSKLNTHVNNPSYSTYTFYTDTFGNVRCSKNNTSPSETSGTIVASKGSSNVTGGDSVMQEIANKTGVVKALRKGLVNNEGDDTEAPWAPDGKWYNEAFDGVTYLYAVSTIDIGIWDPLERSTVLDPKETPQQSSKGSFFTEFNSSFFRSMIDGGPTVNVGTFVNTNGKSRALQLNFGELYESKVFYIPNVTTQDLK